MKKILLLCLSAILAMAAGAATVTGKVVSPSKAPVAGATILFLNGDDSQFSATDDSGVFTIQNAVAGTYFLVIQATGYPEYQNPEVVVGDTDLDLGEIELEVPTYSLNGRVYVALPTGNAELPGALVSVKYVENGETKEALELLSEARFRIFDALVEMPGFAFLAIGRPESSGCYCKVNSYLKEVIGILANSFDYVVIDGEAGIEQIQRRVMDKVTHLLLVTDQSKKGCQVVSTIKNVADELIVYDKIGAIVNRMTNPELAELITVPGVDIVARIPADNAFAANDIKGQSVLSLPEDSLMLNGVKEALQKIEIL